MAEEFQVGGGSWWGSSRARFGGTPPSSSSGLVGMGSSYGWPAEIVDLNYKAIPSSFMNSVSISASTSPLPFQDMRKLAQDPNLQMMGLGLSSHAMDWNQTNSRHGGDKAETRFMPGLQQNTSFPENFDQQELGMESWREKLSSCNSEANGYKQFSPKISSGFHMDPAAYGSPSSTISAENQPRPNFFYPANYGLNSPGELSPSLLKLPHYLRNSPPKQQANSQSRFSDVAPSWITSSASMNDAPSSTFFPPPTFEKPKNKSVVRDVGKVVTKKSSSEATNKRSRSTETPALPPFKVRKEKMGDRITALQQLVSPFGKTDTASVLSEAIEYIKFLHEQVNALINPYMKSGASMQHHLSFGKSRDCKGPKQNLRSRGLCLVPVSNTFPITCETPVDFWSPSYGATLR